MVWPSGQYVVDVEFTVGAEAANVINVAMQAKGPNGSDLARAVALPWYFSSDAVGQAPLAVAHDGGTAIGTDGALIEHAANLSGLLIFEADGDADVDITDAGAFTAYLNVVLPSGEVKTSAVITHAA